MCFGFLAVTLAPASRTKRFSAFLVFSDFSSLTANLHLSSCEADCRTGLCCHECCINPDAQNTTILHFDCAIGYTSREALVNPSFLGKA
jgi:hypothetical protein